MSSTTQTEQKGLGQIALQMMHTTAPLAFDLEMTHKEISVLIGANGTGKTLFLANTFCVTFIANLVIFRQNGHDIGNLRDYAQRVYDKSFSDQNFDGWLGIRYTSGAEIRIYFDKGHITAVETDNFEGINVPTPVKFLSSQMRTFDAMKQYLSMRKLVSNTTLNPNEVPDLMIEHFKFYDVMYMEELILKLPKEVPAKLWEPVQDMTDYDAVVSEIGIDYDKNDFYILQKVEGEDEVKRVYLTTLGKGHQAVFNMFIANFV